jgi:hypothetical protein
MSSQAFVTEVMSATVELAWEGIQPGTRARTPGHEHRRPGVR